MKVLIKLAESHVLRTITKFNSESKSKRFLCAHCYVSLILNICCRDKHFGHIN